VTQQLTAMSHLLLQVASEVVATLRRQGKVVLCGNGGSASDAQHIAAEMQGIREHPDSPQGLLALVLTENTALLTAISNDVGYQNMAEDHTCKGVGECHPYREFEGMQPSR
jgi:phosphoheptose isomerase